MHRAVRSGYIVSAEDDIQITIHADHREDSTV